jgi:hypothetical protein
VPASVLIACSKSHGEMVLARLRATAPGLAHKVHYADLAQISEIKRVAGEIDVPRCVRVFRLPLPSQNR